jgi:hypothetical protein
MQTAKCIDFFIRFSLSINQRKFYFEFFSALPVRLVSNDACRAFDELGLMVEFGEVCGSTSERITPVSSPALRASLQNKFVPSLTVASNILL